MTLLGKIAVVIIFAAVLTSMLHAGQTGFLKNSDSPATGDGNTNYGQSSSAEAKLVFKSVGNIEIGGQTYLKFTGTIFKAKNIRGKGLLSLDGNNIQLNLEYAHNIRLNAERINLGANLMVNNSLKIANGSYLILNSFNLSVSQKTFDKVYAFVIENAVGKLVLMGTNKGVVPNDLLANNSFKQSNFSKVFKIKNTEYSFSISENHNYYHNKSFGLFISQLYPPPTPPPKV